MSTLLYADIFFFITAVAVIAVTIVVLVMAFYLIRILRNARDISRMVRDETEAVVEDVGALRRRITQESKLLSLLFSRGSSDASKRRRKRSTARKKQEKEEEEENEEA